MKQFFADFKSIDTFTFSLDCRHHELECQHCFQHDQFVSHGVVYKQVSSQVKKPVGKRIFCSNRYGRRGCGRTFQLYVADEVPSFRYGAAHLLIFMTALLANSSVDRAYAAATRQTETRNGWRWLNRMRLKLSDYRTFLRRRSRAPCDFSHLSSSKLKHLLPTLSRLFSVETNGCVHYQIQQQVAFL